MTRQIFESNAVLRRISLFPTNQSDAGRILRLPTRHSRSGCIMKTPVATNTSLYSRKDGCYLLKLNCSHETATGKQHIGIWIKPHGGGVYSRENLAEFGVEAPGEVKEPHNVFLFKRISTARSRELERSHSNAFMFRRVFNARSKEWDSQQRMFLTHGAADFSGYLYFHHRRDSSYGKDLTTRPSFLLAIGKMADEEEPWITVLTPFDDMKMFTTCLTTGT
ncbi:HET domain protein [Tolypocladium paradoxum]|uniref:HET domain protein n=1 Tax=Tolypocladium paradoxum TaxID=94208 RepID=A0A2S4L1W2_9HYPO|nr:HET domain protein [Tolypocladium paradoxum]